MVTEFLSTWRDEIETRWALWQDVIEALDRVLSSGEFPGLEQSNPVEDGLSPTLRLTVHLRINPDKHDFLVEIFVMVMAEEVTKVRSAQDGLDLLLKGKLAGTSFTEPNGSVVRTSIQKDGDGIWRATTIDGLRWKFDKNQGFWIKEP